MYIRRAIFTFIGLAILLTPSTILAQNVNKFSFQSFDARYELSRDDENRAVMLVTETLVAEFPNSNQNKGIVREIPRRYQGHPVSFELLSLTRNGAPEPVYNQSTSGAFEVISTGTEEYVRGTQEYEFTYRLRDVILDTGNAQELFWDVNGTGWRQSFDQVSATVVLNNDIADSYTGKQTCFQGRSGSREPCDTTSTDTSVTFQTTRTLAARENLTVVMEFEPDTFAPYQEGDGWVWRAVLAGFVGVASITALVLAIRLKLRARNAKGRGVIVAEYVAPKDVSVMYAAQVTKQSQYMQKATTALLMELAVHKYVRIIEQKESRSLPFLPDKTTYSIEILRTDNLPEEGATLLNALTSTTIQAGQTYELKKADSSTAQTMQKLQKSLKKRVKSDGYRWSPDGLWIPGLVAFIAGALAIFQVILFDSASIPFNFANDWRVYAPVLAALSFLLTMILTSASASLLTTKGRELVDYLRGLHTYIRLAETDRINYLQSPQGAQREAIDTNDQQQIIKLYEKLLPYAIIFGQEKQWYKELGHYYEQQNQTPIWYAGSGGFNAATFSSSMQSISSAASSSSGSGFSGGGGSGGGGGGGGGGGR